MHGLNSVMLFGCIGLCKRDAINPFYLNRDFNFLHLYNNRYVPQNKASIDVFQNGRIHFMICISFGTTDMFSVKYVYVYLWQPKQLIIMNINIKTLYSFAN